jgi:hypothetical protein
VNVEEGRHLWAMVYLLQKYFGRDGREEANELLVRSSGSDEAPRMLGAFNEETPDWLSFFMFTYFTDRDGKMQLESLAQSGFDPLSRTCRFMLTEEAHHMFVGETGVGRTIQATLDAMNKAGITDPRAEIDAVEMYVPFSWYEPMWLESLGFAEHDQGWRMVEEGATHLDGGDLPVNCSGGVLSSNPIGASGMIRFAEAALQVRGMAGEHQVDGARRAFGHAYGGGAQYFAMWVVGADKP